MKLFKQRLHDEICATLHLYADSGKSIKEIGVEEIIDIGELCEAFINICEFIESSDKHKAKTEPTNAATPTVKT